MQHDWTNTNWLSCSWHMVDLNTYIYIYPFIFYSCWIYTCCLLLSVSTSLLSMLLFARHVSQACFFSVIVNFQLHKELFMHKYVRFCASPRETSLLSIEKKTTLIPVIAIICAMLCNTLRNMNALTHIMMLQNSDFISAEFAKQI